MDRDSVLYNITTSLILYEASHQSIWTNTYKGKQGMQDITTDRKQGK